MNKSDSLRDWLRDEILTVLKRNISPPPFIIWCDPARVWKDLLFAAAEGGAFELWAEETHELILREQFYASPRTPRVIWLPTNREGISFFKIFEVNAAEVKEWTLAQALIEYGVDLPPYRMIELAPLLESHMKEWIDRPKSAWKEITKGVVQGTLVDDEKILELITTPGLGFEKLVKDNRFAIFARRVVDEFGLPDPDQNNAEKWRREAISVLLCTDAADKFPDNQPNERERIIPFGQSRVRALKLLDTWLKRIDLIDYFEELAPQADSITALQFWAKSLALAYKPLYSPIAEKVIFKEEVDKLANFQGVKELAKQLEGNELFYREHAKAFWGARAKARVPWEYLVELSLVSNLLIQQDGVEKQWETTGNAIEWFLLIGWQIDAAGERLFSEDAKNQKGPGGLVSVRSKLRKAYLRHLDKTNLAFSELLVHAGLEDITLPFPGEIIGQNIDNSLAKEPIAILILDACRYNLGAMLAENLNKGEPVRRASVSAARAPVPSITALGMAMCLPNVPGNAKITIEDKPPLFWKVSVNDFQGNLAASEQRKEWLKRVFKIKDKAILNVGDVLDPPSSDEISVKNIGKLVFVFGDDFDIEGHEERLKLTGTKEHLDRYARTIRKLRDGGYPKIIVATDHGYFHWDPAPDEREFPKPLGDFKWTSRRAIVGYNLSSDSGLIFKVTGSDLKCCIPRSISSFKTYGGLDFFHGGATLQELIIPVVIADWPKKAKKAKIVLKPIEHIISFTQRIEIVSGAETNLWGEVNEKNLGRYVMAKVLDSNIGKVLFKSKPVFIEPQGVVAQIELEKVPGAICSAGTKLWLQVVDADDEEVLDRREVTIKIEISEWD